MISEQFVNYYEQFAVLQKEPSYRLALKRTISVKAEFFRPPGHLIKRYG